MRLFLTRLAVALFLLCLCGCGVKTAARTTEKPAAARERTPQAKTEKAHTFSAGSSSESKKSRKRVEESTDLPRADPGYLQWLEKQSMLAESAELARIVSGTELPWRTAENGDRSDILLDAADIWLRVHPAGLLCGGSHTVLKELAEDFVLNALQRAGIRGLFIAPAGESGDLWLEKSDSDNASGEDVVSLGFSERIGSDKDFDLLRERAEKRGIQIGGDVLSPAVGMGPDFQLAARAVREYPGAFMMVEMPRAAWGALPPIGKPGDVLPLSREQIALLSSERLLPPAVAREAAPWARGGDWTATGEIRCADGQLRRWVFRSHIRPTRPLLNWDDPSGAAQRIFSGSVIRQVGVLRQALAGIHIEPLIGLDAAYTPAQRGLEPGPSALRSLTREIRRYGGWSIQRDYLPAALNAQILEAGPDFISDNITSPAAEYALLTGDTAPLREMLAASKNLDHRRLMRGLPGPEGVFLHALGQAPFPADAFDRLRRTLAGRSDCPVVDGILYTGGPSLAAAANEARGAEGAPAGTDGPHLLLTAFRAALPGPLFLGGTDLVGALNISGTHPEHAALGGWALSPAAAARAATRAGFEKARTIYPSVRDQLMQPDSYLARLASLSAMRARTGAARAVLLGPLPADSNAVLPVLTRLPDGSRLLTAANFSPKTVSARINLPDAEFFKAFDTAADTPLTITGAELRLELAPWGCRILHLRGQASAPQAPPARTDAEVHQ